MIALPLTCHPGPASKTLLFGCELYAAQQKLGVFFCAAPRPTSKEFEAPQQMNFRRLLLNKCQEQFEQGAAAITAVPETLDEQQELKARRRAVANIIFIGHLYRVQMLPSSNVQR